MSGSPVGSRGMTDFNLGAKPEHDSTSHRRGPSEGPISVSRRGVFLAVLIFTAITGTVAAEQESETLDRQLLRQAPKVIRYLREHGYKSVGVLKFRVRKAGHPSSYRTGPINDNIVGRLENALVAAESTNAPVGIIRDAGGTVLVDAGTAGMLLDFGIIDASTTGSGTTASSAPSGV